MNLLKIPGVYENILLPEKKIIRIEAASNYSRIFFANGNSIVVAKVLQWFQDLLPAELFIRVHRSHLVNKQFVKQINGRKKKIIQMNDGECIVVSKRKRLSVESIISL